jgi:hypothetical protein
MSWPETRLRMSFSTPVCCTDCSTCEYWTSCWVYSDVSIGSSGSWFCIWVVSSFRNMVKSAPMPPAFCAAWLSREALAPAALVVIEVIVKSFRL